LTDKLASTKKERETKKRLAKSTLSLIPLLGVQYLVTWPVNIIPLDPTLRFGIHAFELTFVAIEGFLVALIYCFMNGEVQEEICKLWRNWKEKQSLRRRLRSGGGGRSSSTNNHGISDELTTTFNVTSMLSVTAINIEKVKDEIDDDNGDEHMMDDSANNLSEKSTTCCDTNHQKHVDDSALITQNIPESDRLEHNVPESIL